MNKILFSVGPIHGKLDSVKIITNKFKGGLASLTAKKLAIKRPNDQFTVVKCPQTVFYKPNEERLSNVEVIDVDDFFEYEKFVLGNAFDAYILAGAIANLIPKDPWKGKFPSHDYKEGDIINIPFTISRRVISHVKENFPRSTLIGYKLFDGTPEELIRAGWELLVETKSNAIFCNHPKTAKEKKLCLLPDGSKIEMSFDEHIDFMDRLLDLRWYKTKVIEEKRPELDSSGELFSILNKTTENFYPYMFGCVAYKQGGGFYTTIRGKKESKKEFSYVHNVDHDNRVVYADKKASLNAPLLDLIFQITGSKVIVHSHKKLKAQDLGYVFSGTAEEDNLKEEISEIHKKGLNSFNVKYHGYYAWFNDIKEAEAFVCSRSTKEINWGEYNDIFPERYLGRSEFDDLVKKEINLLKDNLGRKLNILEIGSNKLIRYNDQDLIDNYYVFDKYVEVDDSKVIQIRGGDLLDKKVDLVILRGTINYLNKDEIEKLKQVIIKNRCVLLFNTFKNPTVIKRGYESKSSAGIESTSYDPNKKVITHSLTPEDKDYEIKHEFFYYSLEDLKELLSELNLVTIEKGGSLYFRISYS